MAALSRISQRIAAGLLLLTASQQALANCICTFLPEVEYILRLIRTDTKDIETELGRVNVNMINMDRNVTKATVDMDLANQSRLDALNNHLAQARATLEKGQAQTQALFDTSINQARITAAQAVSSASDIEAAKSTVGSIPRNACVTANQAEKLGGGLARASSTQAQMNRHGRQRVNSIKNPALDFKRVLEMKDRDRVPENVASDAGTMGPEQIQSYLNFLDLVTPTPPRNPASLPDKYKGTPLARAYQADFQRYESAQMYYHKGKIRDGVLSAASIEVDEDQLNVWKQITKGIGIPEELKTTAAGEKSEFPDHWAGLVPASIGGKQYISERDFMRTEVFKRYANPHYQDDTKYGLASKSTPEALLKELIEVANLRNRMLYETMNATLHTKQMLAMEGSWEVDQQLGNRLRRRESDLLKN